MAKVTVVLKIGNERVEVSVADARDLLEQLKGVFEPALLYTSVPSASQGWPVLPDQITCSAAAGEIGN